MIFPSWDARNVWRAYLEHASDVRTWSMQWSRLCQYLGSCQVLLATGVWDREMSFFGGGEGGAKQWRRRILGADVTLSLWYLEMKTEERMEDIMSKPSHLTSVCVWWESCGMRDWMLRSASLKNNSYLLQIFLIPFRPWRNNCEGQDIEKEKKEERKRGTKRNMNRKKGRGKNIYKKEDEEQT